MNPVKDIYGSPSFANLKPSSRAASVLARLSSRKAGTRCELVLRKSISALGLRYRTCNAHITGKPDLVFYREKVAVFCDGDFWHGRNLKKRLARLRRGHNPSYWTAKLIANVNRDRKTTRELRRAGWTVLRFWESRILRSPATVALKVASTLGQRNVASMTISKGHLA